ncbi:BNR repeat-containing protein [Pirellulimonas nuda]|nr:BNR repeat-containing protein [Pirellulimonas nuda]
MPRNIVPQGADWNFGHGSLRTHRGWQYAAYWDDGRQVCVARRKLPSAPWEVVSLPGYQRTQNINRGHGGSVSRGFGDGHEKVSMGISPDGVIHLMFDHHLSTLHYRTSKAAVASRPGETAWSADLFGPVQDHLGAHTLESVTYPAFYTDGDHFLLYLRMGGGSGSANSHLFTYADGVWKVNEEAASKFIDRAWSGGDKTVNAYPHGLAFHDGRLHLTWCWRDTPDPRTCHDLCYTYSDDLGQTWRNNAGKRVAQRGERFITADSPGISVSPIPAGARYVNGGSMTVDRAGRVHVLVVGEDGRPAHFEREPESAEWRRREAKRLGAIVAGRDGLLLVVATDGLWQVLDRDFGAMRRVVPGRPALFASSKMAIDPARVAHDGRVSAIGQQGSTVSVVDYSVDSSVGPSLVPSPAK